MPRRAWGELSWSDSGVVLVLNVWCFDGRCGGSMMGLRGRSCLMLWVILPLTF
jgi:hypothetical protein